VCVCCLADMRWLCVFGLSRIFWRVALRCVCVVVFAAAFVCVSVSARVALTLARGVCGRLARGLSPPAFRTSVRPGAFEQVFETNVRQSGSVDIPVCLTESDRILEPNRTESQPNPDRIGPNPDRISVFNRIFDWLVASSSIA
jgi:hypothetical protein